MTMYSNNFGGTLVQTGDAWGNVTTSDSGTILINISINAEGDVVGSGTLTDTSIYKVPEPPGDGNYVSSSTSSDTELIGGAVNVAPPDEQVQGTFYLNNQEASFGGNFNSAHTQITGTLDFSDDYVISVTLYGQPALPPIISIESGSLRIDAAEGIATFTLSRGPVPLGDLGSSVSVSTMDGTAVAGSDYTALDNEQVIFDPGESSATFTVPIFYNAAAAAAGINPDFEIILSDPINASIGFGTANTTIIESDGDITSVTTDPIQDVSAGQTSGGVIQSGGVEVVLSGGTASGTVVSSGGVLELLSGAHLAGTTTIEPGGTEEIGSGYILNVSAGHINGGVVILSGGEEVVSSGGTASGTVVSSGGVLKLLSGGHLSGTTTINPGGMEEISSGYTLNVSAGQTGSGILVLSRGILDVLSAGVASGAIVKGRTEIISSGGTDDGAQIHGGTQLDYGSASGITIVSGAQWVESGGTAIGTTVSGLQSVGGSGFGGIAISAQIYRGGTQYVSSGGTAKATTTHSGGTEIVGAHGVASGTQISSGVQLVSGLASGTTLFAGSQVVESGGTAVGTVVSGGAEIVDAHGNAVDTAIAGGGTAIVSSAACTASPPGRPIPER